MNSECGIQNDEGWSRNLLNMRCPDCDVHWHAWADCKVDGDRMLIRETKGKAFDCPSCHKNPMGKPIDGAYQ